MWLSNGHLNESCFKWNNKKHTLGECGCCSRHWFCVFSVLRQRHSVEGKKSVSNCQVQNSWSHNTALRHERLVWNIPQCSQPPSAADMNECIDLWNGQPSHTPPGSVQRDRHSCLGFTMLTKLNHVIHKWWMIKVIKVIWALSGLELENGYEMSVRHSNQ